jgi:hypothetical protein
LPILDIDKLFKKLNGHKKMKNYLKAICCLLFGFVFLSLTSQSFAKGVRGAHKGGGEKEKHKGEPREQKRSAKNLDD